MGAGIRPKGSFPYAALRYSVCWQEVPCYGWKKKCPDKELCNSCVHFVGCKDKEELRQTKQEKRGCKWIENEDGAYNTTCGNCFEVMDGTPKKNNMNFCPYCGKELHQQGKDGE